MTARSAAEIRADLADCDRDGVPWPSAARRLLADVPELLARLEAVKALHFPYDRLARCAHGEYEAHNVYRPDSGTYAGRCSGPAPEQSR